MLSFWAFSVCLHK